MHPLDNLPAPKRLYAQVSIWSMVLLVFTSVNVTHANYYGGDAGAEYLTLDLAGELITDDEGYIIKSMPLEGEAIYDQNRTEKVTHEVQKGETLSVLAYRYGVSVNSIKYANTGLTDFLKIGQDLTIPPKDGIYVDIKEGDSLVKLVEKHKGNLDKTIEFNGISEDSELIAGEQLFVMDGRPEVVYIAQPVKTSGSYSQPTQLYYEIPPNELGWIRPTTGIISCGYLCYGGHYAYDIANKKGTPIYAVADGVVTKAAYGWNGGYGNEIIIDHGNGYETLYGHSDTLYVSPGETVVQGQVISAMGNTGQVWGRTGVHLHFEIHYNGTKLNPKVMGVW
ncbi:peptidoglycan DD-metalloendopeptidase family protein [Patescibacteria group bacterium]|nr:peptidoglycan DD-metalloendopeptidase family protein [Patescibacteria group bacterium]